MAAERTAENPIQLAVITGGHGYDVRNFHRFFRSLPGVDAYVQHMDDFASARPEVRDGYDVALFYTMLMDGPSDDGALVRRKTGDRARAPRRDCAGASSSSTTPSSPTRSGRSGAKSPASRTAASATTPSRRSASRSPARHTPSPPAAALGRWRTRPTQWTSRTRTAKSS